jgi:hypothetical protein
MILADSGNYVDPVFGFFSSTGGQFVLALTGVIFLAIAKSIMRPSGEHAFRMDDLAIGPDLLVLSIVTLISYAVTQYVIEIKDKALKSPNLTAANSASTNEVNAGFVCLLLLVLLFAMTSFVQRKGQFSPEKRRDTVMKACNKYIELKQKLEKSENELRSEQDEGKRREKEEEKERLAKELEKVTLDAPRFRRWLGVFIPMFIGFLFLFLAVKVAAHR